MLVKESSGVAPVFIDVVGLYVLVDEQRLRNLISAKSKERYLYDRDATAHGSNAEQDERLAISHFSCDCDVRPVEESPPMYALHLKFPGAGDTPVVNTYPIYFEERVIGDADVVGSIGAGSSSNAKS